MLITGLKSGYLTPRAVQPVELALHEGAVGQVIVIWYMLG